MAVGKKGAASWRPQCKGRKVGGTAHGFVLYRDLAKAVRNEPGVAVCYWWGVSMNAVTRWRRMLGVGRATKGTLASWWERNRTPVMVAARRKGLRLAKTPEALAKWSAARRGRQLSDQHREALRRAMAGKKLSEEHRRKIGEGLRRGGHMPPGAKPWTKAEDALVRRLPAPEVARRTGRSLAGVYIRRHELGVPDGRRRGSGKTGRWR